MPSPKQAAQPNPQLSRPVSSGHHVSTEHRLRRKHLLLNLSTKVRSGKYLKERQEKHKKEETFFLRRKKMEKKKHESEVTPKFAMPFSLPLRPLCSEGQKSNKENCPSYNGNFWTIFCGFKRLLRRVEKEIKGEKRERKIKEKKQNEKKKMKK